MDTYAALYGTLRTQRGLAQDPVWASDLCNTEICLDEYKSEVARITSTSVNSRNRRRMRGGINVPATSVNFRFPSLFHNGNPVKVFKLCGVHGLLKREQLERMIADLGIRDCGLSGIRSSAHSTTARLTCSSLASSCRLQLAAALKRIIWTRYSRTLHESEKFAAVRPMLSCATQAAPTPRAAAPQQSDRETLLFRVVERIDLLEYIGRELSYEDLSNIWLICRSRDLVRLIMRRRVDASWPGFVGQNAIHMIRDYIGRFCPGEIIFSDRGIVCDAATACSVLDRGPGGLTVSLHTLDVSGVKINTQLIELVANAFSIVRLVIAESCGVLSVAFSRVRVRQLCVAGNKYLQGDFLQHLKARLETLSLTECGQIAYQPVLVFACDNLIFRELSLCDCDFLSNDQCDVYVLLLEALINENSYLENLTMSFSEPTGRDTPDGRVINLSNSLTIKELNISNNLYLSHFVPQIVANINNVKVLNLSGVPFYDYIDMSELWCIESLYICYAEYLMYSLSSLNAQTIRYIEVVNKKGKSKTKLLDLGCIEQLIGVDHKFSFKFLNCKTTIPAALDRKMKRINITVSNVNKCLTLSN
ncbi:hypothetical protein TKK_0001638 [Trichogramma kaykai]